MLVLSSKTQSKKTQAQFILLLALVQSEMFEGQIFIQWHTEDFGISSDK